VYYVVGCRGLVRMTYWRWSAAFSLAVQGKPDRQALNFRQTKIRRPRDTLHCSRSQFSPSHLLSYGPIAADGLDIGRDEACNIPASITARLNSKDFIITMSTVTCKSLPLAFRFSLFAF
jgi:hypothetical protein